MAISLIDAQGNVVDVEFKLDNETSRPCLQTRDHVLPAPRLIALVLRQSGVDRLVRHIEVTAVRDLNQLVHDWSHSSSAPGRHQEHPNGPISWGERPKWDAKAGMVRNAKLDLERI
jgi:hypothetical protein